MLQKRDMNESEVKRVSRSGPPDGASPASDTPPDAPRSLEDLDFEPQSMVGWYAPGELVRAGAKAVTSAVFGAYADKREVEPVLADAEWYDYSEIADDEGEGLWIDYVADLGDGWDSTYTIARLLAEEQLGFDSEGHCTTQLHEWHTTTRRGRILIMGGDQVYPTASREEYNNRTIQPYRYALPFVRHDYPPPDLFLVPGNHDWYDGLNSFLKLFCQRRWVGGWRTVQRRSYFALKLDAKLWLWGIDIQLNSDIDQPQLDYFKCVASEAMQPGSRVILCTADPSWVYVETETREERDTAKKEKKKAEIYNNLGYLEKTLIKPFGHEICVGLSGDNHHYVRYEAEDGSEQQRFVCGGGGAYLYPTHNLPESLKLPEKYGGQQYRLEKKTMFPAEEESAKLAGRSWRLPLFPLNVTFALTVGGIYLLLAWLVQSISTVRYSPGQTLLDRFRESFDLQAFIEVVAHSPASVAFMVIVVGGLIAFSDFKTGWKKVVHGGLHGLAHIALFLALVYAFAWLNLEVLELEVNEPVQVVLFGVEMLLLGGLVGGFLFGGYLWLSNRLLRIHDNEVLLCQSNPDHKSFLRLHVDKEGRITFYPIGVKRVNRKRSLRGNKTERRLAAWKLQPEAKNGEPWFEPAVGTIHDVAELIDEVTIGQARVTPGAPTSAERTEEHPHG